MNLHSTNNSAPSPRDASSSSAAPSGAQDGLQGLPAQSDAAEIIRAARAQAEAQPATRPLAVYPQPAVAELSGAALMRRERAAARIQSEYNISAVTARILAQRGFKVGAELDGFFNPHLSTYIQQLSTLRGLSAATKIILAAVRAKEQIAIVCDYDADGATSAAMMSRFLRSLGAKVLVLSPDRASEGHGLNKVRVSECARKGAKLLIALDFGTKSHAELSQARFFGMKTVVIDHHHAPDGPPLPVDALINPRQAGCGFHGEDLCTAGLTWLTLCQMRTQIMKGHNHDWRQAMRREGIKPLAALAALGTVADVVELTPCNRAIVNAGLKEFTAPTLVEGLAALKEIAGISGAVTAEDLAFELAPRINAISRTLRPLPGQPTAGMLMTELLATSSRKRAGVLAHLAESKNRERKELERTATAKILERIEAAGSVPDVLFVTDHEGAGWIQGIIAARLVERYNRPAFVMRAEADGTLVGSARGVSGVHLAELLEQSKHLLLRGGGHAGAAGFSLKGENLPTLQAAITAAVSAARRGHPQQRVEIADVAVSVEELVSVGPALLREFALLEPCGRGNPRPTVFVDQLTVVALETLNSTNLKVWLRQGEQYIYGYLWRHTSHPAIVVGASVDVVARPFLDNHKAEHAPEKQRIHLELRAVRATPSSDLAPRSNP